MDIIEVKGQSMSPYLGDGEIVSVRPIENIKYIPVGSVLLLRNQDNERLVHRLLSHSPLRTKGDNVKYADQDWNENITVEALVEYRLSARADGRRKELRPSLILARLSRFNRQSVIFAHRFFHSLVYLIGLWVRLRER